jgi:hypothetical protein
MGVPTSEVGYTSATTARGDHEVHKGHVVAMEEFLSNKIQYFTSTSNTSLTYSLLLLLIHSEF